LARFVPYTITQHNKLFEKLASQGGPMNLDTSTGVRGAGHRQAPKGCKLSGYIATGIRPRLFRDTDLLSYILSIPIEGNWYRLPIQGEGHNSSFPVLGTGRARGNGGDWQ
jgi:hypothetical protein